MRTRLWDRQGANIASRYREMYGVRSVGHRMLHSAVIL